MPPRRETRTDITVWPRASWADRMSPLPILPSNDWTTGSPNLSRRNRLRSAICSTHPHAKAILFGIAEFSPYLFDLVRADAARLDRGCCRAIRTRISLR